MKQRKILVINDDKNSLGELVEILTVSGHELVLVHDALLAVDAVVRTKPDVVLVDLAMPRKNGFELADEINYALPTRKIPIIAMSSLLKEEFKFLFNLCGINRHLKKPFRPLDVIWAIENAAEESLPYC